MAQKSKETDYKVFGGSIILIDYQKVQHYFLRRDESGSKWMPMEEAL